MKDRIKLRGLIAVLAFLVILMLSPSRGASALIEPSGDGSSHTGYNTLGATQQSLYDSLKADLDEYVASEEFLSDNIDGVTSVIAEGSYSGSLSASQIIDTYMAFAYDNPQFFFLGNAYTYYNGPDSGFLRVHPSAYYLSAAARARTSRMVEELSDKWVALLSETFDDSDETDNDTDDVYEISVKLHNLILRRIDYAHDKTGRPQQAAWAHSIGGVFTADGAVCEGYAKAFSYILNRLGVENIFCTGSSHGELHAWNCVRIGGKYYYIDITWDDLNRGSDDSSAPLWVYEYVFMPSSKFLTDHSIDDWTERYSDMQYADDELYCYAKRDNTFLTGLTDPTCEDPGKGAIPPTGEADLVIWAGGRSDLKKTTLKPSIKATQYKDSRGRQKAGKLVYVVKDEPTVISFDTSRHTVQTKSDKKTVSVSSKGVVTAKAPGIAYIYVCDTGTMETQRFTAEVRQAPTKLTLSNVSGSSDRKNNLKRSYLEPGQEGNVYIVPSAKADVDEACTYSIQYKTDADRRLLQVSAICTDSYGSAFFVCKAVSPRENNGRYSTVKLDVICNESGKKSSITVYIGNPLIDVERPRPAGTLQRRNDSVSLPLSFETALGKSLNTTDRYKFYVGVSEVTLSGTKVKADRGATVKVKYDKKTGMLTLKAGKDASTPAVIYMSVSNTLTKEVRLIPLYRVTEEGSIELL